MLHDVHRQNCSSELRSCLAKDSPRLSMMRPSCPRRLVSDVDRGRMSGPVALQSEDKDVEGFPGFRQFTWCFALS